MPGSHEDDQPGFAWCRQFKDFLKAYPKDPKAPRAQLSIATAYANQKKFDLAMIEFDKTIQAYPESDTKCTALYKKGETFDALKQAAQAKLTYQSVVKECPNTPESSFAADALAALAKRPAAPAAGARGK